MGSAAYGIIGTHHYVWKISHFEEYVEILIIIPLFVECTTISHNRLESPNFRYSKKKTYIKSVSCINIIIISSSTSIYNSVTMIGNGFLGNNSNNLLLVSITGLKI